MTHTARELHAVCIIACETSQGPERLRWAASSGEHSREEGMYPPSM